MQMSPNAAQTDPLAQLKDIHPPSQINWWPLDWGWWTLLVLLLVAISTLAVFWLRRRAFNRARKAALVELSNISETDANWPMQINSLLKRTSKSYFSNEDVAILYGRPWLEFMLAQVAKSKLGTCNEGLKQLTQQLYSPSVDATQFTRCKNAAKHWLKHANFKKNNRRAHAYTSSAEVSHV